MLREILLVASGGAVGSVARFAVGKLIKYMDFAPHYATLICNILGSFIIGVLLAIFLLKSNDSLRLLLVVGFCGAFTTFSTFTADTFSFISIGNWGAAFINILLNVVATLIAIFCGISLVNWIYNL